MNDEIDDGVGRYASRTRINRRVLDIVGDGTASISGTIDMNGKISRIVLDMSRMASNSNGATQGSMAITMDAESDGGTDYKYCETVSSLDFRTASNLVGHFQIAEGANTDTAGAHLTINNPAGAAGSWNGAVCGRVKFTLSLSNSKVFTSGASNIAKITILHE